MEKRKESQNKNKKGGLKARGQRLKAGILKSYYGNPMRLRASGEQVAVLASDQPFKLGMLHKFLSDAWKAGANVVIVTVPAETLRDNVFYGLPVHVAAMTNFTTSSLKDMTSEEYLEDEKTLFSMKPEIVIMNRDDVNYEAFATEFKGEKSTLDYGLTGTDVKILNSKLYPKGTEATLSIKSEIVSVATFVPGETAVSYMACATAIAKAMDINTDAIVDGIAEYQPE